jgi:hypothetical protein
MYKNKFVLSIIHDGCPVREDEYCGIGSSRQVVIPFGDEYIIRLKNKNDRGCTARITIDGTPVSSFGDIIINNGGTVDLERFITTSMDKGKKFKFVSLDHPDVDDPTKSENGIIKVEFRLSKSTNTVKVLQPTTWPWPPFDTYPNPWNKPYLGSDDFGFYTTCYSNFVGTSTNTKCKSLRNTIESGATIEGGNSNQTFTYSNLDVEESPSTTLTLKMVGINKNAPSTNRYCTNCGAVIRKKDKYCGNCGKKL